MKIMEDAVEDRYISSCDKVAGLNIYQKTVFNYFQKEKTPRTFCVTQLMTKLMYIPCYFHSFPAIFVSQNLVEVLVMISEQIVKMSMVLALLETQFFDIRV